MTYGEFVELLIFAKKFAFFAFADVLINLPIFSAPVSNACQSNLWFSSKVICFNKNILTEKVYYYY